MGYSWCRFRCGIPDREMGSVDLYDGKWIWPSGLAHYVEAHDVLLPEDFVQTMRDRCWQPPIENLLMSTGTQVLRGLGYWSEGPGLHAELPDPSNLVKQGWYGDELPLILNYLRGARSRLGDFLEFWDEFQGTEREEELWDENGDSIGEVEYDSWMRWAASCGSVAASTG